MDHWTRRKQNRTNAFHCRRPRDAAVAQYYFLQPCLARHQDLVADCFKHATQLIVKVGHDYALFDNTKAKLRMFNSIANLEVRRHHTPTQRLHVPIRCARSFHNTASAATGSAYVTGLTQSTDFRRPPGPSRRCWPTILHQVSPRRAP